jgi:DNA-binding NarL/FixJ family response regulator
MRDSYCAVNVGGRAPVSGSTKDRPSIVIAEDSGLMLTRLQLLLGRDCEVLAAVADGAALVDAVRIHRPDVIVSDIDMPRMNGFEAARAIRAEHPEARIVFVTAMHDPALVREALALLCLGFVCKRDAGSELVPAVRAAMEGRKYLSESCWSALDGVPGSRPVGKRNH